MGQADSKVTQSRTVIPPKHSSGQRILNSNVNKEESSKEAVQVEGTYLGAYRVLNLLGAGSEGEAYLVEDADGKNWALKVIKLPLPKKYVESMFHEIQIQAELGEGHNNIIAAEELILTSHYLGLVIEWAPGGTLTDLVTTKHDECQGVGLLMPEDEVRYLFKQIVNAVDYMHKNQVAHRDIKLDNTLLSPPYPPYQHNPPYIKLCDFGFAREWGANAHFSTVIGTPDYMAPQVLQADGAKIQYDGAKADVWAMGVLLCVMLIGKFPFEGDTVSMVSIPDPMKQVWLQQSKRKWNENALLKDQIPYMSAEAFHLLDRMFDLDETSRIDINGIKSHPWFKAKMRPHLEEAIAKMEEEQRENERRVAEGAFSNQMRDEAVKNLIRMASSPEIRELAAEPIKPNIKFEIISRIRLRTMMAAYPKFDRKSMHAMLSRHKDRLHAS
ncbi:hypothetical protein CEUSTIGMA_g6032.t1 [Chlamydomonas eustigma]|uniref:Protein kinase domain-containing protein n=1 Tax=Chlamydomonas eustigma TaxID=1157962 RepID=A0A250X689_9CHLO|nr:hypothetical protein CEUSTIGMA_g6032.t1 [Chlamydomonas eustigma]|eukprot:GAX78593.1 hypothetical protein CEUSTIGMA_g6032.t1 [Chlamydomonas eustigma]